MDWLNEERLEHSQAESKKCGRACKGAHILFTSQWGRERERERKTERERLNFYACKGAHTLFTGQRERERERGREKEGGRERCRLYYFLFLKGMTGALTTFSYIVNIIIMQTDWLTEWGMLRVRAWFMLARVHTQSSCTSLRSPESAGLLYACIMDKPGNTKGGRITIPLTSCLTGLEKSILQIKTKIVSCHTADSKPDK